MHKRKLSIFKSQEPLIFSIKGMYDSMKGVRMNEASGNAFLEMEDGKEEKLKKINQEKNKKEIKRDTKENDRYRSS